MLSFSRDLKTDRIEIDKPGNDKITTGINSLESSLSSKIDGYQEKIQTLITATEKEPVGAAKFLLKPKNENNLKLKPQKLKPQNVAVDKR
ncbi:MAG: hypothetical protein HC778_00765 [Chamaesiphon sp. CSU_1_12]|nr:hypothetical protein [Chamaesiphon sp. CSU_1_12]